MPDSNCGVRIRREKVHFDGWSLAVGHEWIEFVDAAGQVNWSAGFWPDSWWPLGAGQVFSPDPMGGDTRSTTYTVDIFPLPGGSPDIDDCEDCSCEDIRACIESNVASSKAKPPIYSLLFNNCRDWVDNIIEGCCLTVNT